MQSGSSGIWTRVAVSISYDDNHYTTGTSLNPGIDIIMNCRYNRKPTNQLTNQSNPTHSTNQPINPSDQSNPTNN